MKLNKVKEIESFMLLVDSCNGGVYLTSQFGDKYNLKSKLTQYLAVAQLLNEDNNLELWCDDKADEAKFMHWFVENPDTL